MSYQRQKLNFYDDEKGGWIPGMGDNKPRPQSSRSQRSAVSSINDCILSDAGSSRSGSPVSDQFGGGRRRPRTANAADSSQMREVMWSPPSPESNREEVVEEPCIAIDCADKKAIPFFTHESGAILIKGGTVVNDDKMEVADVIVEDGKIAQVGEDLEVPSGAKIIDATDKFVMPGGIDTATNFKSDEEAADDFQSGTRAALAGGTTTVVDLVVPGKEESLLEAVASWKEDIEASACCDVALTVAITRWDDTTKADIEHLVKEEGINSFKVSMAFKDEMMLSNEEILDVFDHCKSVGAVVHVHAENGTIIAENEKRLRAKGIRGPEAILMARPEEIEEEAVKRVCTLARHSNVPIIIDQPTSLSALEVIRSQKEKGQVVVGQASAISMVKNGSEYYNENWSKAAALVTSPPLRDDADVQEAIVDAALQDIYAAVCSNHKPYVDEAKKSTGKNDFSKIPHGHNGVEERLAVIWDKLVASEKSTATKFVSLSSSSAAKMLNIWPQKGRIEAESDADIIIWNPNNVQTISSKAESESKADTNVFDGVILHGAPEYVIANGRVAVFEYEMNPTVNHVGAKILTTEPFPSIFYDQVQDLDDLGKVVGVVREGSDKPDVESVAGSDVGDGKLDDTFGLTAERKSSEPPVFNAKLGSYQRPVSAHGVRNQQDSTFSLTGGYNDSFGSPKRAVKINAPPGGSSRAFW